MPSEDEHKRLIRSRNMSAIRNKNTKPELLLRKSLFALGFRYRLHTKKMPGKPDLVFPKHKAVIFVHGCFWHGHDCSLFRWPKTNTEFWTTKIERNRVVDLRNHQSLIDDNWRVLTVWECSFKGPNQLGLDTVTKLSAEWILSNKHSSEIRSSR